MFIFLKENNTGFRPVPFHRYSPLHTLKVNAISVKLNRKRCKQSDFDNEKKNAVFKSFVV